MLGSLIHTTEPRFYLKAGEPNTGPVLAEQAVIHIKHKLLAPGILLPQLPLNRRKH